MDVDRAGGGMHRRRVAIGGGVDRRLDVDPKRGVVFLHSTGDSRDDGTIRGCRYRQ